jgi:hypothetical protein
MKTIFGILFFALVAVSGEIVRNSAIYFTKIMFQVSFREATLAVLMSMSSMKIYHNKFKTIYQLKSMAT